MFRLVDEFFEENGIIAEGVTGFAASFLVVFNEVGFGANNTHTTPAAAGGSFDHDREADTLGFFDGNRFGS